MNFTGRLESPRLFLQELEEAAAEGPYLAWMQDFEVLQYLEARFLRHTSETLASFIQAMTAHPDILFFGIFLKENGRHIGNIKLGPINRDHQHADIGLLIGDKSVWGQGFATEAITVLTHYAFDRLKLNRLNAGCYGSNEGSVRAFVKSGWMVEGRLPRYWRFDEIWMDHILLGCLNPAYH